MTEKNIITKDAFMGFRVSESIKIKIERYARENGFNIGDLLTLAALLHIGDKAEAGKLLIKLETKKK